jgi:hypothetical protein
MNARVRAGECFRLLHEPPQPVQTLQRRRGFPRPSYVSLHSVAMP